MQTIILAILIVVALNVLAYLPVRLRLRGARRMRLLQEARADICACATAFQRHLAGGDVVHGQYVHDVHYEAMNAARYFNRYLALKPLFGSQRKEVVDIRERIERDMRDLPPEIKEISDRFLLAYIRAAYYRHPVKFKVLLLALVLRFFVRLLGRTFSGGFWIELVGPRKITMAVWFVAIGFFAFCNLQWDAPVQHSKPIAHEHRM